MNNAIQQPFTSDQINLFEDVVKTRRSVRGFLDKRVPQDVISAIFETARWSPSGTNVQPWHTCVASGELRDKLRNEFLARIENGVKPNTDHKGDGKLGGAWRDRKRACARVLYDSMGIEWEDMEGRARAGRRNFELFDAPHIAFICMDDVFGIQSACDVGMYTQTLMLAMTAHGVGNCAQGTMRNYPDLVREAFDLPESMKVLFGISFGYEDTSVAANNARTERATVAETVSFRG